MISKHFIDVLGLKFVSFIMPCDLTSTTVYYASHVGVDDEIAWNVTVDIITGKAICMIFDKPFWSTEK